MDQIDRMRFKFDGWAPNLRGREESLDARSCWIYVSILLVFFFLLAFLFSTEVFK